MSESIIEDLRERLVKVGKAIYDHGLATGAAGNISARVPNTDMILIKCRGARMAELAPRDLVLVDIGGKRLRGKGVFSVETPMHIGIYKARKDVHGVVHSHAPTSTALGIAGIEVIPLLIEAFMSVPKGIPIVPFEMPGTQSLADSVQKKIVNFDAVVLQNHGIVTVGSTIEEACDLNVLIEECAKVQYMATTLAGKHEITMGTLRKRFKT